MEDFKIIPDESVLFTLNPEEVTLVFYVLGIVAAKALTINEINVLANGLFEMAQVMFVIAAQRGFINDALEEKQTQKEKKSVEGWMLTVEELQNKIENLQQQINQMNK